jgi:hypothetical protein
VFVAKTFYGQMLASVLAFERACKTAHYLIKTNYRKENAMTMLMLQTDPEDLMAVIDTETHVREIKGRIQVVHEDGPVEFEDVGRFRCYQVDVGRAMNNDIRPIDVFDAHSSLVCDYYEALYTNSPSGFCEFISEKFDEVCLSPSLFSALPCGAALWAACRLLQAFQSSGSRGSCRN